MRLSGADVAVIAILVAGLLVGAYFYTGGQPRAKSVLSFDRIRVAETKDVGWHTMENGYYKTEVKGKWIAHLAIDHPTAVDFMDTMETDAPDSQYGEGARFRAKERVRLEFKPPSANPAYAIGDAELWFWAYSDAAEYDYERHFPWYEISGWEGVAVPYKLTLKKGTDTLKTVEEKTVVAGPSTWPYSTTDVTFEDYYNRDVLSVKNISITSTGEYLPSSDVALFWDSNAKKRIIKSSWMDDLGTRYDEPTWGFNATDTWKEFVKYNTNLEDIRRLSGMESKTFEGRFGGPLPDAYIGSGGMSEVKRLYWEHVPPDWKVDNYFPSLRPKPSSMPLWSNRYYDMEFPWLVDVEGTWHSNVLVEADAQKFDTVVWLPPSGDFAITSVADGFKLNDWDTGTLLVKAKNVGDTPATGVASIDTPSGITVVSSERRRTVGPGETAVFSFQLKPQLGNEKQVNKSGSVTVRTDKGTGTPSTKSWSLTVKPSAPDGGPGVETGTVTGVVLDAETGEPIRGATVRTDMGVASTTGPAGEYEITGVQEGTRKLTAFASGYQSATVTVSVDPNTTNSAPPIRMSPKGVGLPWVWIGVGVAIVSAAGIALMIMHEREVI